jgi:hypothetical protein
MQKLTFGSVQLCRKCAHIAEPLASSDFFTGTIGWMVKGTRHEQSQGQKICIDPLPAGGVCRGGRMLSGQGWEHHCAPSRQGHQPELAGQEEAAIASHPHCRSTVTPSARIRRVTEMAVFTVRAFGLCAVLLQHPLFGDNNSDDMVGIGQLKDNGTQCDMFFHRDATGGDPISLNGHAVAIQRGTTA